MKKRVLLVDDEPHVLVVLEDICKAHGWTVEIAQDGETGLRLLDRKAFDVAIVDLVMPQMTGLEMLQAAEANRVLTPIIILTGYGSAEIATEAFRRGAVDFVQKPVRPENLVARMEAVRGSLASGQSPIAERMDRLLSKVSFDPNLKLAHLAAETGLNPGYASDLLKACFGMAFLQRLAWHRVRHAKMLIEFDEPLKAIAPMCGFKTQSRMTEAFLRFERMSPKKYQILVCDRRKNP